MPAQWEKLFDGITGVKADALKSELVAFLGESKKDSELFIKRQAAKIEKYLVQLANGEITKAQFESSMKDIEAVTRQKALELSVKSKARAQKLADGIKGLILSRLLNMVC